MTIETKSGKAIGAEYVLRIKAYLERTDGLPLLGDGNLNISAIALAADIPRQSIYKNPTIRSMLEAKRAAHPVPEKTNETPTEPGATDFADNKESKRVKALEKRVNLLEQQNASLVAENGELRRQLKSLRLQMGREDMTIETGRRLAIPVRDYA